MVFSAEIKRVRKQQLLSQEELAKELGVSFATVNRWEKGKYKPTYKTKRVITNYCQKNNIDFNFDDCE